MTTIAEPFRGNIVVGDERTLWVETRGTGPDVLLLGGLTDPVESWQFQLDGLSERYRLIAFDNAGAGRSPLPRGGEAFDTSTMADDAVSVLGAVEVDGPVHVAGFSGGTQIAQQLALRNPELVRSLVLVSTWARRDAYFRGLMDTFRWLVDAAPSERAALEAFFLWIYTPRAHDDGMAGGLDIAAPPRYGKEVADAIPGAVFEVWPAETHQPFQEVPEAFNA